MKMLITQLFNKLGITSFKRRLRFWFTCITLLMVLLASIPFVCLGRQQQRHIAAVNIDKMINMQEVMIENWLKAQLSDIKALAQLPAIKGKDEAVMRETMEVYDEKQSGYDGIVFVNKEGISEVDTSGPAGLDLSDRLYFKKAKEGESYITDVLIGRQTEKPLIILSAPVYDHDDEWKGLIFGSIPITAIHTIMSEYQDEDRETFLVNQKGMLITESHQGKIGETITTEIIKKALAGERTDHFYQNHNGIKVIGDYRWVHNHQWLIIGEVKKSIIYQPFYRMAIIFSSIFILLLFIGSILIIRISNRVEAPIREVLEGTRNIGEGNWSYRLSPVSDGDEKEFQELREKFNQMAELIEKNVVSMAKSEERFRMITDYSSDMITIHDLSGKYLYVSPAGKELLQYENEEILGSDSYFFIHEDDLDMVRKSHEQLLQTGYAVSTYRVRRKDGEYIWFESSIKFLQDKSIEDQQIIVISRNITERKRVEEKLQHTNQMLLERSTKDGLTGVWNRQTFDERLESEWNRSMRNRSHLSLIMIDIDYFKAYNDRYGHQAGDECLKEVTAIIRETVKRPGDMVCRFGGEEFSVILPETDERGVKAVAERIRIQVENLAIPHEGSQINEYVTVSIGTNTIIPTKDETTTAFIKKADTALYKAKQDGRNCVRG